MMSFAPILALISLLGVASAQYGSTAFLFSGTGCSGAFQSITDNQYDLSTLGWSNRAYSVRIRGPWLFYDLTYYNEQNFAMEYIFESSERCVNFIYLNGLVSSMRYAGHLSDYRQDRITFYDMTYFQAQQELIQVDTANLVLGGTVASIIVTGSSDWTIYERPNYGGYSYCLRFQPTPSYTPGFLFDTTQMETPVSQNFIRSVRKGCHAVDIIHITRDSGNGTIHGTHEV